MPVTQTDTSSLKTISAPDNELAAAAVTVAEGGLVIYPTETLWGLGCDPANEGALQQLRRFKGLEANRPLTVAVARVEALWQAAVATPLARRLARDYLPGPLTLVLKPRGSAARDWHGLLGPGGRLGLRVPDHPLARRLLRSCGPLVATSANLHGQPPASSLAEVKALAQKLRQGLTGEGSAAEPGPAVALVMGRPLPRGRPSTVVEATGDRPRMLRQGALTLERMAAETLPGPNQGPMNHALDREQGVP